MLVNHQPLQYPKQLCLSMTSNHGRYGGLEVRIEMCKHPRTTNITMLRTLYNFILDFGYRNSIVDPILCSITNIELDH